MPSMPSAAMLGRLIWVDSLDGLRTESAVDIVIYENYNYEL